MAGRPIKDAPKAQPVKGGVIPENEKPRAMHVDIYCKFFAYFFQKKYGFCFFLKRSIKHYAL